MSTIHHLTFLCLKKVSCKAEGKHPPKHVHRLIIRGQKHRHVCAATKTVLKSQTATVRTDINNRQILQTPFVLILHLD